MFKSPFFLSFFLLLTKFSISESNVETSWNSLITEARNIMNMCGKKLQSKTWNCIQKTCFSLIDKITSRDEIPLLDNVRLVKIIRMNNSASIQRSSLHKKTLYARINSCSEYLLEKLRDVLKTYVLEINFTNSHSTENAEEILPRHRRRNQMLPIMVFGVTAFGMILIPIGFQFLAVLGGKALLLAKMALLLASINGLKKVATSGVHYGLYHAVPEHIYRPGLYDRGDQTQLVHPRADSTS